MFDHVSNHIPTIREQIQITGGSESDRRREANYLELNPINGISYLNTGFNGSMGCSKVRRKEEGFK